MFSKQNPNRDEQISLETWPRMPIAPEDPMLVDTRSELGNLLIELNTVCQWRPRH